jgi:hypothetical protein
MADDFLNDVRLRANVHTEERTYPWQGPLFMKRVLGVDGALPGAVRQKCATCKAIEKKKSVMTITIRIII